METLDIIILILLLIDAVVGYRKGLVQMVLYLASVFVAIYVAKSFSMVTLGILNLDSPYANNIAVVVTFIATLIAVMLLARLLSRLIKGIGLGVLDGLGGSLFSIARTVLVLGFLFIIFEGLNQNEKYMSRERLDKTMLYNPILESGQILLPYIPIDEVKTFFIEFSTSKE
ncbi:MAG: CvpA family protein [Bacteroidetes bacterium]|nr:CvpA family protein [Bacteroidota bacterium]